MHQCVLRGLKFAESHWGAIVAVANAYSLEALAVHDIVLVLFPAAYLRFAERALCFGARARVGSWINDGVVDVFATGSARGGSVHLRMLCKARRLHANLQHGRESGLLGIILAPAL